MEQGYPIIVELVASPIARGAYAFRMRDSFLEG